MSRSPLGELDANTDRGPDLEEHQKWALVTFRRDLHQLAGINREIKLDALVLDWLIY